MKTNINMKRLLLFIVTILLFVGCGVSNKVNSTRSIFGYVKNIDCRQLDSICIVDGLNRDVTQWMKMQFYDYETSDIITEWLYVKDLTETYDVMYILREKGNCKYRITKRITVTNIDE